MYLLIHKYFPSLKNKPTRDKNHIIETKSKKFLERYIPDEWIINEPQLDYGIDYNIDLVENFEVTGYHFSIQLKGKLKEINEEYATVNLKRTTLNYYHVRFEPTLLVIYIIEEDEAYWTWINTNKYDLTSQQEKFQFKISKLNKLSKLDWNLISQKVEEIFSKKILLDNIPSLNFSKLDEKEKLAWRLITQRKYDQAAIEFSKLIEIESKIFWIEGLAMCYYYSFRYDQALITINKALEIEPTPQSELIQASILAESGLRKREKGRLLKAEIIFQKLITKETNHPSHRFNYANTLSALQKFDEAETQYLLALESKPNYAEAWKNLGQVYFHRDEHKKEIECYDKALKINPKLSQAYMSKGITLLTIYDEVELSLEFMLKSIKIENNLALNFPIGFMWLAEAYSRLGKFENALKWIKDGLNSNPQDQNLLNWAYLFFKNCWDKSDALKIEAKSFFKYCIDISESDYSSLYHYSKIKNTEEQNLKLIYEEITSYTNILKPVSFELFSKLELNYIKCLDSLLTFQDYSEFRYRVKLTQYSELLEIEDNSILTKFFATLDFVFGSIFNRAYSSYFRLKDKEEETIITELIKTVYEQIQDLLPKVAPILVIKDENEIAKNELEEYSAFVTKIVLALPKIGIIESSSQIGFISAALKMNKDTVDVVLKQQDSANLFREIAADTFLNIQKVTNIKKNKTV